MSNDTEIVLDYLRRQNRPYNAQIVADNLKGAVPKAKVQKILDQLTDQGDVTRKEYSKQFIYLINQAKYFPSQEVAGDGAAEDQRAEEMSREVADLAKEIRSLEETLRSRGGANVASVAELKEANKKLESANMALSGKIVAIRANKPNACSASEFGAAGENLEKMKTLYRKRRGIGMEILNQLSESLGKKVKVLAEDIGVDLDDSCGFDINAVCSYISKPEASSTNASAKKRKL